MPVILRIALRNLREHRSKTLIIGIIIAVGIMIMTVGTSLIDTASKGIEEAFIENYTGDILIGGYSEDDLSIFGVQSVGGIEPTPQIPEYSRLLEFLESRNDIEIYTPQVTGFASISIDDQEDPDARGMTFLFGIEPESYRQMFDRIEILEGSFLKPGESGILLTESNRDILEERLGKKVSVGDSIRLTGFSNTGIKIREVEIKGFYRLLFASEGINMSSYIDIPTLRSLKGMNLGGTTEVLLDDEQVALLETDDFDDLFSDEVFGDAFAIADDAGFGSDNGFADPWDMESWDMESWDMESWDDTSTEDAELLDPWDSIPGNSEDKASPVTTAESPAEGAEAPLTSTDAAEATGGESIHPDNPRNDFGGYEFILISMENQLRTNRLVSTLNQWFEDEGIAAQAMNWKGAAGPFSSTADVIQNVFNIAVLLVAFVALIIITNTLLISVMERKKEIGTMRAMGAGKGFVTSLFTTEIVIITLIFGIIGELLGLGILGIVSLCNIEAGNTLVEILFAGHVLRPVVEFTTLAADLVIVVIIGILANIYPVYVALKIQPVKAISSI